MNPTEQSRFWVKVDRRGPDDCWLWTAATKGLPGKRYGNFRVKRDRRSVGLGAHVASWEYANGPVPDGLFVCHHCDVKLCVNPAHLFLGTALDNNRDMVAKRRHQFGERHWNAKLARGAIDRIHALAHEGKSQRAIGLAFGIGQPTVSKILGGRSRRYDRQALHT